MMDITTGINFWAVLVAAVASMVIGSIWFGPMFGKMYISLMGMDKQSPEEQAKMKKGMTLTYVWQFIASIVMFYVLAWFMVHVGKTDVMGGVKTSLWAWLGFIVTMKLGDALWGGKIKLFWLGAGNSLITMVVGGIILGLWH
jgi:hypothetical protein